MSKSLLEYRRVWAMPNLNTFSIIPINKFIKKNSIPGKQLDPFPYPFKEDALKLMMKIPDDSIDLGFFDPVYSRRQENEIYLIKGRGEGKNYQSHPKYFSAIEDEWFRIIKPKGRVLKFMWNSKSIPGFEAIDGIIVPHGGQHNDTICTAFEKTQETLF